MPLADRTPDEFLAYRPEMSAPEDFHAFRQQPLAETHARGGAVKADRVTDRHLLTTVEVDDVRFPGWNGEPVAAWLLDAATGVGADGLRGAHAAPRGRCRSSSPCRLCRRPRAAHRPCAVVGGRLRPTRRRQPRPGPRHSGPRGGQRHPLGRGLPDPRHRLTRQLLLRTPHDGLCAPRTRAPNCPDWIPVGSSWRAAAKATAPALFSAGLIDPTCPPGKAPGRAQRSALSAQGHEAGVV